MNLAHQRRRLVIAMTVTVLALVLAMAAVVASFGFHQAWGAWVFVAAILGGFASHGWLILGVLREKSPS